MLWIVKCNALFHHYQNKIPNINKAFVRERKRGIWGAATIIMLASHHHQTAKTPYGQFFVVVAFW